MAVATVPSLMELAGHCPLAGKGPRSERLSCAGEARFSAFHGKQAKEADQLKPVRLAGGWC
jgi:hypothetical protein